MKQFILIATLVLISSTAYCDVNGSQYFDQGKEYIDQENYPKAFQAFKKAADQGNADAQLNLGISYATGIGVLKDPKQAVAWYQKAADQGNAKAQYNLGISYANGEGVLKDMQMSKHWIKKANDGGHENASKAWEKLELWKY